MTYNLGSSSWTLSNNDEVADTPTLLDLGANFPANEPNNTYELNLYSPNGRLEHCLLSSF